MKAQDSSTVQNPTLFSEDLQKQRQFVNDLEKRGFDFGLVISEAFVRGMRDLGYKSTATALDELIDNSIQAEASRISIEFGFDKGNKSKSKPDQIFIIDNGHGMDPDMIRIAAIWGGTHRENDRTGFGRYGYGLPSASVSIGKKYSIYSKVFEGDWHKVEVDIDDIGEGKYLDKSGKVVIPPAEKSDLPAIVSTHLKKVEKDFQHGTVVLIDKIDRLDYKKVSSLRDFLLRQIGVTYRNYLNNINIFVDGTAAGPIDPLFISPGARYYDEDEERAMIKPELLVEVKDKVSREVKGSIKVRYSLMPPTFLRIPQDKLKIKGGDNNNRFTIRKENNGVIVLRAGRQIDVINSKCPWTTFQNNDRYIGIEIDFPPELDEDFSITTSKQQVVPKESLWAKLEDYGVFKAISQLRTEYKAMLKDLEKRVQEGEIIKKKPSESAMEDVQKFLETAKRPETPEQQKKKKESLDKEIKDRAAKTGKSLEDASKEVELEISSQKFKVDYEDHPGAPFYRVSQVGGQLRLFINKGHRFYSDIYMGPESTPRLRYAIHTLLFVLGDCELSSTGDKKLFYEIEKHEWSRELNIALEQLSKWDGKEDESQLEDEMLSADNLEALRNNN